ncbi:initiator tRNA phosphoribosyl transferase [Auricularia subglabra TFB-10046 SS5]|nr:initiator tRNA phosphoribosyl transferase [Auricularia subglabra TFB-10046 SS5]
MSTSVEYDQLGLPDATAELRRESVDVYNRLHSIDEDAQFVSSVAAAYADLPLLPNLRCGAWYTDPKKSTAEPVYFKSTDGHFGQWAFNLRRANLHLLSLVEQRGGVILVDSTRRGKRLPDALAKTVPIWCAVINCAISRRFHVGQWQTELFTPPATVSASEHDQIKSHIEEWANELLASQYTLPRLPRPLRPFWVTPSTRVLPVRAGDGDAAQFFPIICVSASKLVDGSEALDRRSGYVYVQGSGDDHELWSQGLTPHVYWKHRDALLSAARAALPELISSLLSSTPARAPSERAAEPVSPVRQVGGLLCVASLGAWDSAACSENTAVLRLPCAADAEHAAHGEDFADSRTILVVQGKKGQFHFMNTVLPQGCAFARAALVAGKRVCIACEDGKDVSVGLAVAVLQQSFDDAGRLAATAVPRPQATKDSIRKRLQWVLESRPGANPARTTLKRVHEFLMSPSPRSMPAPRDPPR